VAQYSQGAYYFSLDITPAYQDDTVGRADVINFGKALAGQADVGVTGAGYAGAGYQRGFGLDVLTRTAPEPLPGPLSRPTAPRPKT